MNNKLRLNWVLERDAAFIHSGDAILGDTTLTHYWRRRSGLSRKTREPFFSIRAQLWLKDKKALFWDVNLCSSIKGTRSSYLWKDTNPLTRPLILSGCSGDAVLGSSKTDAWISANWWGRGTGLVETRLWTLDKAQTQVVLSLWWRYDFHLAMEAQFWVPQEWRGSSLVVEDASFRTQLLSFCKLMWTQDATSEWTPFAEETRLWTTPRDAVMELLAGMKERSLRVHKGTRVSGRDLWVCAWRNFPSVACNSS